MKLYRYSKFIKESTIQSKEDIDSICRKYGIGNYTINDDGSIDVDGDVDLQCLPKWKKKKLNKMPLEFRNVTGYFDCSYSELISLKGSPRSVGDNFLCNTNKLTSLDGSPVSVGGDFICYNNQLTSLYGGPTSVGGNFYCHNNDLTSLEGSPESVGGDFACSSNQLTSLEGSPESIGGIFYCHSNKLTSLEFGPYSVGGGFYCGDNKLTSLEGIPKSIGRAMDWRCSSAGLFFQNNNLRDVRGIKDGWRGKLQISGNPVYEIFKIFPEERYDEVVEYLNEYEVIRGKVVVLQALEQVFLEMGMDIPEIKNIKGYEII